MADYLNSFETGLAAGTALTAANSGEGTPSAGHPFTNVVGAGQTFTATAMRGTLGLQVAAASGVSTYFDWVGLVGQAASFAYRFYFRVPALPAGSDAVLAYLRGGSTGGTGVMPLLLRIDGTLRIQSDAASGAAIGTTTGVIAVNTWYRAEVYGTSTGNAATGEIHLRVYLGDDTVPIANLSLDSTTANLAHATIGTIRWGRATTAAATPTIIYDDVAFRTGSATPFGPSVSNAAPTANAGPDQANVEPWSTVTLSGTDSDSDGTIASRAWTQTGGSPTVTLSGTDATRTFEAPGTTAGTTLTFQYSATDNAGATATDTMTVTVLPVAERILIGGTWVPARIRLV